MKTKFKPKAPMLLIMTVAATMSFSDFVTNKAYGEVTLRKTESKDSAKAKSQKAMIRVNVDDENKPLVESDFGAQKPHQVKSPLRAEGSKQKAQETSKASDKSFFHNLTAQGIAEQAKESVRREEAQETSKASEVSTRKTASKESTTAKSQEAMIRVNVDDKSKPLIESNFGGQKPLEVESPLRPICSGEFEKAGVCSMKIKTPSQAKEVLASKEAQLEKVKEKVEAIKPEETQTVDALHESINALEVASKEISRLEAEIKALKEQQETKNPGLLEQITAMASKFFASVAQVSSEVENKTKVIKEKLEEKDETLVSENEEKLLETIGELDDALDEALDEIDQYEELACEYEDKINGFEEKIDELSEASNKQLALIQRMQMVSNGLQAPGLTMNPFVNPWNTQLSLMQGFMMGQQMMSLNNALNPLSMLNNSGLNLLSQLSNLGRSPVVNNYNNYGNHYGQQPNFQQQFQPMQQQFQATNPAQSFMPGINSSIRPVVNWNNNI